jgi:restriction endonuclease S subunit
MQYNTYKESGIEWIGMIPEHWEVKKLKYLAKIGNGKDHKNVWDENGIYPIIGTGGIFGKANKFLYDKPSVLLGRKGTIDNPQFIESPFWVVDTAYFTMISGNVIPIYFYYLTTTINFEQYKYGSAVPSMTQEVLKEIYFALPPKPEQTAIAAFLDRKTAEIDSLIEKKQQLLALYEEEKTAIINQAVTKGVPGRDAQIGRLHKSTNAGNTEDQPIIPGRDAQFGRLHKSTNADKTEDRPTVPGRDAQFGRLHNTTNADNTENQPIIPGRDAQFGRLHKSTNADNTENQSTIPGRDAQFGRLYKSTNADNTEIATNTPAPIAYKYSGIEWIGMIPEHWEVVPLTKYLDSIIDYRGKTPKKRDYGMFLVTARNIKNGRIDYSLSQEFVNHEEAQKLLSRGKPDIGDVLFTTEAPLGEVANIDNTNIALAQRIVKFRGKKWRLNNYFLKFYLLSDSFQQDLYTYATGSTALGIKGSRLHKLILLLPPLAEQTAIVQYIETETQRIDRKIAKTKRLIKLLQEYKTTLISDVVTGQICVL